MKKKKLILSILSAVVIMLGVAFAYQETGKIDKEQVHKAVDIVANAIETYTMSDEEVKALPTTEIKEVSQNEEQKAGEEQATTEKEGFELQGRIAYNGDSNNKWKVKLGDYKGLTYYSQIDSRWKNKPYTSTGNKSQTIGSSGCGPTCASMVVTAIKGTITPPEMANLFVKYGYRSANDGTYFSAFRAVADNFNIGYKETSSIDEAIKLLRNKTLVVVSCGNGLFTTGGHYILLVGIDGNTIKIYDPYLYAGKFDTSTRRGKVTVKGNTVYCSITNFKKYANAGKFFAYKEEGKTKPNDDKPVKTSTYTRYVKANGGLNVRKGAGKQYKSVKLLKNKTKVTVEKTKGDWSYIINPTKGWVKSKYLTQNAPIKNTVGQTKKLKATTTLYSKSNLTGTKYTYKANTTVTIKQNINNKVDKIKVKETGRVAYTKNNVYK